MGCVENLRNVDTGSEQGAGPCSSSKSLPPSQLHPYPCPGREPQRPGNCDSAPNFCPGSEASYHKKKKKKKTNPHRAADPTPASVFLSPGAQAGPPKSLVLGYLSCSHDTSTGRLDVGFSQVTLPWAGILNSTPFPTLLLTLTVPFDPHIALRVKHRIPGHLPKASPESLDPGQEEKQDQEPV